MPCITNTSLVFQANNLQSEVVSLREAGAGGYFQAISLPEGMTPTSSDVIASLNEHLVQTLHVCIVQYRVL